MHSLIKFFLLALASLVLLLVPLTIKQTIYSKDEQKISCGFPFKYMEVDYTRYDQYPWKYDCLFNPMEENSHINDVNLLLSYGSIFVMIYFIDFVINRNLKPSKP